MNNQHYACILETNSIISVYSVQFKLVLFVHCVEKKSHWSSFVIRVFHSLYKVGRNGNIGIKGFKNTKKSYLQWGLDLMQEIITGLWVQ